MAAITSNHIQGRRSKRDTSKTVVWEFWDGRGEPGDSGGRWAKIFKKAQRDLEAAYNSAPGYDLTTMTQQNTTTNYIRAIRRKLIAEAAPDGATDDQPHRPKPGRTSAAPPDVGDDVTCSICCAAQVLAADQEELLSSGCRSQHGTRSVCDECVQQHIREEVMGKANSTRILCPQVALMQAGCKSVLEHQDIQRWAIASVFETYDTLLLRQTLQALPDFRWCSHAGCGSGQLHEGGDAAQIVRCEQCRRRTCFTHRCVWHEGRTCEQYDADARASEEVALLQALEGGAVKRCPSCRIGIEKNEGCDHMTCKRDVGGCGHEFCWRCDAPYAGAAGIRAVGNRAHARTCQYHM